MNDTIGLLKRWLFRYVDHLWALSLRIVALFERRAHWIVLGWCAVAGLIGMARAFSPATPVHNITDAAPIAFVYTAIVLAPALGFYIARLAFPAGHRAPQPDFRLSLYGRWLALCPAEAKAHPAFGPVGLMASVLIGLLLNVVIRSLEFFASVPAMSQHAPGWGQAMFALMGLDVILTSFFYMVAFVMALRAVPLFPRMLVFAWSADLFLQLYVANALAAVGGLPANVIDPLVDLITANMTKVIISAAIWLPYLILSERVNVTYRHRTAAR